MASSRDLKVGGDGIVLLEYLPSGCERNNRHEIVTCLMPNHPKNVQKYLLQNTEVLQSKYHGNLKIKWLSTNIKPASHYTKNDSPTIPKICC